MAKGGARPGAGRPKVKKPVFANKSLASEILSACGKPLGHPVKCSCEPCRWIELLNATDQRLRFDVLKYLTDRRDGKPMQMVKEEIIFDPNAPLTVQVEFIGRPPDTPPTKAR